MSTLERLAVNDFFFFFFSAGLNENMTQWIINACHCKVSQRKSINWADTKRFVLCFPLFLLLFLFKFHFFLMFCVLQITPFWSKTLEWIYVLNDIWIFFFLLILWFCLEYWRDQHSKIFPANYHINYPIVRLVLSRHLKASWLNSWMLPLMLKSCFQTT